MKVFKKGYVLYVNGITNTATYAKKGSSFDELSHNFTLGEVYDCSFRELVDNLKILSKNGLYLSKRK